LNLHVIELPKHVIVGPGAIQRVANVVNSIPGAKITSIVVVAGPNVTRAYGSLLREPLESLPATIHWLEAREPTLTYAEKLVEEAKSANPQVVIGFGGGKSIDLAKYVAQSLRTPFISIPTSASHDGIASPFASLRGAGKPYSFQAVTPYAIVADIDIISRAPLRLLRAGSGDLIGKLTAVRDWKLAHKLKGEYYGEYAAKLALLSARHVIDYADLIGRGSPEAVRIVVEGLISSGVAMCIAGSTRPASGSEHLFAHAVEMLAPGRALHGELVALGTIMMMYLHGGNWRRIRYTMRKIGLPVRARDLGLRDDVIIEALVMAHKIRPERYTILGESGLTRDAAEKLAHTTGVI
jgi:glycerol-1-phosphate dehydrogenase [NAD(P)+]